MFGDVYTTKYMGNKITDRFGRVKFWLPQNLAIYQNYAASSYRELLMLVSDFMVNSRLKILYVISMKFMECLMRIHRRRKRTLSVYIGDIWSLILFTTCANLLDTKYV